MSVASSTSKPWGPEAALENGRFEGSAQMRTYFFSWGLVTPWSSAAARAGMNARTQMTSDRASIEPRTPPPDGRDGACQPQEAEPQEVPREFAGRNGVGRFSGSIGHPPAGVAPAKCNA